MWKLLTSIVTAALVMGLQAGHAQTNPGAPAPKSELQIMKERNKACEGLKDRELRECQDSYVGPDNDAAKADGALPREHRAGSNEARDKDTDSSKADMTTEQKRGPVGPIRSTPTTDKQ